MKKIFTILIFLGFIPLWLFATHNRAGQITFELVSGYTYKVRVTTFTYTKSAADRDELEVFWGDNTSSFVRRNKETVLANDYKYNTYETTHTYPGPGIYNIFMQDPNRNLGINNIPNSVNVIFSIKSTLIIAPEIGKNTSPQLLNFPLDRAALGHIFIHNPAAYDPDGDSISYKITICTGQNGIPIADYTFPKSSDTIYVDAISGDLVWNTPIDTGKYNVAIDVEEWRFGVKIGNITRDMQINVYETENNPPVNPDLRSMCVEAGTLIELQMTSTDADNDPVVQTMSGGPLALGTVDSARFTRVASGPGFSTSTFRWQTTCDHIRNQPWQVLLKSEDINSDIQLVDLDHFNITVLAPSPKNPTSVSTSNEINLNWNQSHCGAVIGYYIYRREGGSGFTPDSCTNGVPASAGFIRIASIAGSEDTTYTDDNNGQGLIQGIDYCYRITAFYEDGSESYASEEICNTLVPGFPSLLNISVTQSDQVAGNIFISWAKPVNFDALAAPGPYVFQIYRSQTGEPNDFVLLDSILTSNLNDTVYTDTPLNTLEFPYYYSVRMFNNTPGNRFEMRPNENEIASSLYIEVTPADNQLTLNILKRAPWINNEFVIYRSFDPALPYDSLTTVNTNVFTDTGLKNGVTYYYQVKSNGWRPIDDVIFNNSNISHINSGTPLDITAPCAPDLFVRSVCDSNAMNILNWTNPNKTCADDVVRYKIYYSSQMDANMDSLVSITPATDTSYFHQIQAGMSLAGCYAVSAIDSFGNESPLSTMVCVDQCSLFELPNVFTPNGDEINDIYTSININDIVEQVDMKIFNRYGQLVFETDDPDINWEGTYKNSNTKLGSGVYYYICDVYEPRISGIEIRTLVGFIHLYADGNAHPIPK